MKLYSPVLLALSASLADFPLRAEHARVGEARSRSCGSSLKLGLAVADNERVTEIGLQVSACAVGQSAAAIFARGAKGVSKQEIEQALEQIDVWLSDPAAPLPTWPGFEALDPAREHKGRHEALRLPWRAAISALSSSASAS
jgi:NifU-like protein involved in Fe-S cluster formation